jgi:hypothetical protein
LIEVLAEYPDNPNGIVNTLGIVDAWNTRKNPTTRANKESNSNSERTNTLNYNNVELNALTTDIEYVRKMMGLSSSKVKESLFKQVSTPRVTHLALGRVGRAGMMAHIKAHNEIILTNKGNHRSMRRKIRSDTRRMGSLHEIIK